MKNITLFICLAFMALAFADENNKQKVYIIIDGQEHQVIMDEEHTIKIGDKEHKVKVRLAQYKSFNSAGISFKHPSRMAIKEEKIPMLTMWMIEANDITIMIQDYSMYIDSQTMLGAFTNEYKRMQAKTTITDIQLETKTTTLKGHRILVQMGSIQMVQNVFFINRGDKVTAIILQGNLEKNGQLPKEYQDVEKIFSESFEQTEKPKTKSEDS